MIPSHEQRTTGGFSLVEVLVATLILGFGIVGIMHALTGAITATKSVEHHAQAVMQAASHLEGVTMSNYLVAGERTGTFEPLFPFLAWEETIEETALDGLHKITLTVSHARTGEPIYKLITQKFVVPLGLDETAEDRLKNDDPRYRDEENGAQP
jgi:type II secretory pathway pseudopilin PulG